MKSIHNIARQLSRSAALALLAMSLFAPTCRAAIIEMRVHVKGQDVQLVPDSHTGGLVSYSKKYGYHTDRAQRGETMVIFVLLSTVEEVDKPIKRCWLSSAAGQKELGCYTATLPSMTKEFTVPTNPAWTDTQINLTMGSGTVTVRLPIGTRP